MYYIHFIAWFVCKKLRFLGFLLCTTLINPKCYVRRVR